MTTTAKTTVLLALAGLCLASAAAATPLAPPQWLAASQAALETDLVTQYGETQRPRARRGLAQTATFWVETDGAAAAYGEFVRQNFAGTPATLDALFQRFAEHLEALDGHLTEINHAFRRPMDLELGPVLPLDETFGGYDPFAHVNADFFRNKLAFVVLLNFPLTTLEQRRAEGPAWTRRQWAEARLAQRFSKRVPAEVNQAVMQAAAAAELYISGYKIWMHHVLDATGGRPFPPKQRLIAHWNLRDEIKAQYSDGVQGLARQRLIQLIMERIIDQTIPAAVIDSPYLDWNPVSNAVKPAAVNDATSPAPAGLTPSNAPEPDTRYAKLLATFQAVRLADPYFPTAPTFIERRFNEERQIPEARVRALLEQVLTSPLLGQVARLIATRLGRPLEPFDLWYDGFRPRDRYPEAQLDAIVAKKYPRAESFRQDFVNFLPRLGFTRERAEYLREHIVVEGSRGSGHAMGAVLRGQPAHLRTQIGPGGLDYKGYNIALHEMGHNIEETFSLNGVDHWLLQGVPNNAFTEAIAYIFQAQDLALLGLTTPDAQSEAAKTLGDFWVTCEISAVGLVDMEVWHWMYAHPQATPAQLKTATLQIARDVWNRFLAPAFGRQDVTLLAVYSHLIQNLLYLPDYPIGHLICAQIEEQMQRAGNIGQEVERMTQFGNVDPDLWMNHATGAPLSAEALLQATQRALTKLGPPAPAAPAK